MRHRDNGVHTEVTEQTSVANEDCGVDVYEVVKDSDIESCFLCCHPIFFVA